MSTHGFNQYKPVPNPVAYFWASVDKTGECWLWTGGVGNNGYGYSSYNRTVLGRGKGTTQAHRVAYALLVGPPPAGKVLHHTCETKLCCNPAHLDPVTRAEHNALHNTREFCKRGHLLAQHQNKQGQCRACERILKQRYKEKTRETKRRWRERRRAAGLTVVIATFALFAGTARADVRVTLQPEATPAQVRSDNAYLIHVEADEPVTLADLLILLPGHGQPCGQTDEYGYPYGGDASTNFSVPPQPGVSVSGRWVTISGPFLVDAADPLDYRLAITLPDIAACFYGGSTADLDPSSLQVPVLGIAQGGELDVAQHDEFSTGGYFTGLGANRYELHWWTSASADSLMIRERLGLPTGFTLVSSTLGDGKRRKSADSFSYQWDTPRPVPAGDYERESVVVDAPCSQLGSTIHARLRVWRSDGLVAGTGDGPELQLPAC